jgi:hypothetical protein
MIRVLATHGLDPAPRHTSTIQFLHRQAPGTVACDFFSVDIVSLHLLYVLFFVLHRTRPMVLSPL